MRLLSWIFQPVYLIFFVIIAALYIYREEVIPEHRDIEQSKALVTQIEQAVVVIEEEGRSIRSVSSSDAVITDQDGSNQPTKLAGEVNPQLSEVAAETAVDNVSVAAVDDTYVGTELTPEDAEKPSDLLETASEMASAEVVALVAPVEQAINLLPESLGTLWYAARKAARGGNSKQAIERYLQLTSNYPDSADGFGELGNIYYAMGDKERALGAYQQALMVYQSAGDSGQSLQLQRVIGEIQ